MAIVINGDGIDMGGNPVSNVDVGSFDNNAATVEYVKNNGDVSAVTGFSQISGVNEIVGVELTNNIHNIFNDGSSIATYTLNGNVNDLGGTYNGIPTNVVYEEGKFGQAANITNGYIKTTIPDNNTIPNITFSFFFKGTGYCIIARVNNGVNGLMFNIANDNGFIKINNLFAGFGWSSNILTNIPFTSDFHHCVYQITPTNIKIYIDKVEVININGNRAYDGGVFYIGTSYGLVPIFTGSIDQVRIFNRALTEAEINTLYTEIRVSEDVALNINQGTFIYPKGLTSRGYVKSSDTFTGSVPTSGVSDGWKYVAKDENDNFSFYTTKPTLGKTSAELYLKDGKLYKSSDDTAITPISLLSNKVRFASGVPMELSSSGIAKSVTDSVEAKEVLGKNQCTAWVNFDGTTTPPTIRDSYNVSSVVRVGTGQFDIYFKEPMDSANYIVNYSVSGGSIGIVKNNVPTVNKVRVESYFNGTYYNVLFNDVQIIGGKNNESFL